MRTTLTIKVETIDYDTQACMLRLKGRNVEENQFVKVKSDCRDLRNETGKCFFYFRWVLIIQ